MPPGESPRTPRAPVPLQEPRMLLPLLAPGLCHQSWEPGINSYLRRADPEPRFACWIQTMPCPSAPMKLVTGHRKLSGCKHRTSKDVCQRKLLEQTKCGPCPSGSSHISHTGFCAPAGMYKGVVSLPPSTHRKAH